MSLSKTFIENATDKIAAQAQTILDALDTCRDAWDEDSLYGLVDALGDSNVETALGWAAARADAALYPEHYGLNTYWKSAGVQTDNPGDVLGGMVRLEAWKDFLNAINTYVTSSDGMAQSSLSAYLTGISARVHPIVNEIALGIGSNIFALSGATPDVFAPAHDTVLPDAVYVGTAGSWTDDTTDATSTAAGDVVFFAADDDIIALGFERKVNAVAFALGTLSSANVALELYYSAGGSTYTQIGASDITDGTTGMTTSGLIQFTIDGSWVRTNVDTAGNDWDGSGTDMTPRYYLLLKRTEATVVTPPVATQIQAVPEPILSGRTTTGGVTRYSGLVTQPPLGILDISAANTISLLTGTNLTPNYVDFDHPAKLKLKVLAIQGTPAAISALTISYTDQGGTAATQAQTISWTPSAISEEWPAGASYLSLGSDTGVRGLAATGWTVTTTMTNCILAVVNKAERTPAL